MRTSFCSIAYRHTPRILEEIIPAVAKSGYDGLEVWGDHLKDRTDEELPIIAELAGMQGIALCIVSPYLGTFDLPMTNHDEMIDRTREYAQKATVLGVKTLRSFAGWTCECTSVDCPQDYWDYNVNGFKEMCRIAADHGLQIAIETHDRSLTDTVEGCERFLGDVGSDALKLNLQFDGLGKEIDLDRAATYRRLAPHIVHMHVEPVTEEGEQDPMRAVFSAMHETDFSGFISVENCSGKGDPGDVQRQGLENLGILGACDRSESP